MTIFCADISTPFGIEPGECCSPARFGGELYGAHVRSCGSSGWDPGLTSSRGSREAPGGHRARHGRPGDSADRLRRSGTEHVHTCALKCGNVTLGTMPVSYRVRSSTQVRGRLPRRRAEGSRLPEVRGGADPGALGQKGLGAYTGHGAVILPSGIRERRPGGHRARQGRLDDTADRLSGSGTDHVHTSASLMKWGRVNRG